MKSNKLILIRHGKNSPDLGRTLPGDELLRARQMGELLHTAQIYAINLIAYSGLPRAIQTAFALLLGWMNRVPDALPAVLVTRAVDLAEAIPALGNDTLFEEMTAPPGFREVASAKGNYRALAHLHLPQKIADWTQGFVRAFDDLLETVDGGDTILLVLHSPVIEMLMNGLLRRQGDYLPVELVEVSELDAVLFTVDREVFLEEGQEVRSTRIRNYFKLPAPSPAV